MANRIHPHRRVRVLVVHRRAETLQLVGQLTPRGFEVSVASDLGTALHAVASCRPQIVVTGVDHDDPGGLELGEILRQQFDAYGREVPIIALTAYPSALRVDLASFTDVLCVPCSPYALATALCRAIVRAASSGSAGIGLPRALGFARARKIRPRAGSIGRRSTRDQGW